uniref:Uncharacterized protein n=1 Tax=Amphimedon queenslandica TaxID=400682 RepID=A0A1X7UL65_AMPQE
EISNKEAKLANSIAICLLGKASAGMSKLRRKKILKLYNPDIADLAEEDLFQLGAPKLFGSGVEVKIKERAESLKLLAASRPLAQSQGKKFFHRGHPTVPPRGGGQSSQGRPWQKKELKAPARK